jgi:hypothetical protein
MRPGIWVYSLWVTMLLLHTFAFGQPRKVPEAPGGPGVHEIARAAGTYQLQISVVNHYGRIGDATLAVMATTMNPFPPVKGEPPKPMIDNAMMEIAAPAEGKASLASFLLRLPQPASWRDADSVVVSVIARGGAVCHKVIILKYAGNPQGRTSQTGSIKDSIELVKPAQQ